MTRRVILSARANAYISQELIYLRNRSLQGTRRFRQIVATVKQNLERFDRIGNVPDAPPFPNLRRMVAHGYIFDYVPGNPVVIVSIRHGRQSPESWESSHLPEDD